MVLYIFLYLTFERKKQEVFSETYFWWQYYQHVCKLCLSTRSYILVSPVLSFLSIKRGQLSPGLLLLHTGRSFFVLLQYGAFRRENDKRDRPHFPCIVLVMKQKRRTSYATSKKKKKWSSICTTITRWKILLGLEHTKWDKHAHGLNAWMKWTSILPFHITSSSTWPVSRTVHNKSFHFVSNLGSPTQFCYELLFFLRYFDDVSLRV